MYCFVTRFEIQSEIQKINISKIVAFKIATMYLFALFEDAPNTFECHNFTIAMTEMAPENPETSTF